MMERCSKAEYCEGLLRLFGKLGIDGRRQLEVTAHMIHAFFDTYLKGSGSLPLDASSPGYPEIEFAR